jgi:hypothetical protein
LERASTELNRIGTIKPDIRRDAGSTLDRRQGGPRDPQTRSGCLIWHLLD